MIAWLPTASVEIANVHWPLSAATPLPNTVVRSSKITAPVGVPEPSETAFTAAVKVTVCPYTAGAPEAMVVLVSSWFTATARLPLVLATKFASPL